MASSAHIPEEEAAKNLSAWLDRALAGEEVFVRRGEKEVRLVPETARRYVGRTGVEVVAILDEIDRTRGLARMDSEFAADMEAIHEEMNHSLGASKWD